MNALAKTPSRFLREELREEAVAGTEEDLQVLRACVRACAFVVCACVRVCAYKHVR